MMKGNRKRWSAEEANNMAKLLYRKENRKPAFSGFPFSPPLHGIIPTIFENAKNGRKKTGKLFLISCLGVPFYAAAVIPFLFDCNFPN